MIGKYLKLKLNFGVIYFLMSQLTLGDILSNLNIGITSYNQLEDDLDIETDIEDEDNLDTGDEEDDSEEYVDDEDDEEDLSVDSEMDEGFTF